MHQRPAGASRGARSVPTNFFRNACPSLERDVRSFGFGDTDIDPYRPGGSENPLKDANGWCAFWRQLQRLHAVGGARSNTGSATGDADEAMLLDAIREAGKPIELALSTEAEPQRLVVRQLSFEALQHLNGRDALIGILARQAARLSNATTSEDAEVYLQVTDELAYQQAVCVWIACESTQLPFDPLQDPRPKPPEWARAVTPIDIPRIIGALHRVNGMQLLALQRIIAPGEKGERASWLTYFAAVPGESDTAPLEYMRNRGLVGLIASKAIAADTQRKAFEAAKQKAASSEG